MSKVVELKDLAVVHSSDFLILDKIGEIQRVCVEMKRDLELKRDNDINLNRVTAAAETILRFRRDRDALFVPGLFGEPAWDMLLFLFVEESKGNVVTVTNLCRASAVPSTTALRCISKLINNKLVTQRSNPDDKRKQILRMESHIYQLVMKRLASLL